MSGNAAGFAALDAEIRKLQQLGPKMIAEIAPIAAAELRKAIVENIARSVGPDGSAWLPTQDWHKALRNAGSALTVNVVGTAIVATLTGPEARHHLGAVRGGVKREMLPKRRLPDLAVVAIRKAAAEVYTKYMGG